jgi:hypothetical protein
MTLHTLRRSPRARLMLLCCLLSLAASPPALAVLGCGVLETHSYQGNECLLLAMNDYVYWLTDYGGFAAGDTVFVAGTEQVPSMVFCGMSRPGIGVETIQACRGVDFGCGTLFDMGLGECSGFTSWRYGPFALVNWGGFQAGDTVRVYGRYQNDISWCDIRGSIFADSVVVCPDSLTVASPTTWGRLKALFR